MEKYLSGYLHSLLYSPHIPDLDLDPVPEAYHEALNSLAAAKKKGQAALMRAWQVVKKNRPDLVRLVEVPPVSVRESLPQVEQGFLDECFETGDTGDAHLLAKLYGDRLVYDHSTKQWFVWAGHYWRPDDIGLVRKLVSGQCRAQYYLANAEASKAAADSSEAEAKGIQRKIKLFTERGKTLCGVGKKKRVLEEAQTDLALGERQFDERDWLLACPNGTLDLLKMEFGPGRPEHLLASVCETEFAGFDAPAPRWREFMCEIFDGDTETVAFIQRLFGYALTGTAREHVFQILWGAEGRNGKDTLIETLSSVLGHDLASAGESDLLTGSKVKTKNSASEDIMDLKGARLKWVSESEEGARLNVNQIKRLTGGNQLKARPLFGHLELFRPRYLLMLITNNRPNVPGDDKAFWQRAVLIPFNMRFVDNPAAQNERKKDPDLKKKLEQERAGILAWLLEGCRDYLQGGLRIPDKLRRATDDYQQNEDLLGQFIEGRCELGTHFIVSSTFFREAYEEQTGLRINSKILKERMTARGFGHGYTKRGAVFQGLRLAEESEEVPF
jgi:putative DNA primase/helicase